MGCGLLVSLLAAAPVQAQAMRAAANEQAADTVDVWHADTLIRQVFHAQEADRYHEAAEAYLALWAHLENSRDSAEQVVLLRHLRQVAPLMPVFVRAQLGLDAALQQNGLSRLPDDAGQQLIGWWRRQDNLPATPANERLEEHLARVAHAVTVYRNDADPRGFDDRGEIFVRLGPPAERITVEVPAVAQAFDFTGLPTPKLPDNEFWVYPHVHAAAQYVFIRRGRTWGYRLDEAAELIPPNLRATAAAHNPYSRRKTLMLLQVMEAVYGQLALRHPDAYGTTYDELAAYVGLPDDQPGRFAQHIMAQVQEEDMRAAAERAEAVPAVHSNTYRPADELPVAVRWARFLDPDGTTRTEVYWGFEPGALQPSRRLMRRLRAQGGAPATGSYLITVSVEQQEVDYHRRRSTSRHYLASGHGALPPHTFAVQGDTAMYHLAMQWDQRGVQATASEALEPGTRLQVGTVRVDSLQALRPSGPLEMSDLKPLLRYREDDNQADLPYPFAHLSPETPLTLYFELYHLTFGSDDQTHYVVEYEVVRTKEGGVLGFFRKKDEERTAAETRYTGHSRTAREHIALDLSTLKGTDAVTITVRVTDETTGQQVERAIVFAMAP